MRNTYLKLSAPLLTLMVACAGDEPAAELVAAVDALSDLGNEADTGTSTDTELETDASADAETSPTDTGTATDDTSPDADDDAGATDVDPDTDVTEGPQGWIGSPCESAADCDFDDAECLPSPDHPDGMCSVACDRYCPDREGFPVTFCTDTALTDGGYCHSRCDYAEFPGVGCRDGYACQIQPRYGEEGVEVGTCVVDDGTAPEPSACVQWLIDHEVPFEPVAWAPRAPETHPDLLCTIEDPVRVRSPINGIHYRVQWDEPETYASMLMGCDLARTLYDMGPILDDYGIVEVHHMGTVNCRVIGGTDVLSEHAFGRAIDIAALIDAEGEEYSVLDDWEHDTEDPVSAKAQLLYDFAYRIFDEGLFHIVLTPNYNAAHDNHFHVDLTPGGHFIKQLMLQHGH